MYSSISFASAGSVGRPVQLARLVFPQSIFDLIHSSRAAVLAAASSEAFTR